MMRAYSFGERSPPFILHQWRPLGTPVHASSFTASLLFSHESEISIKWPLSP